jgi:hypothetical protein
VRRGPPSAQQSRGGEDEDAGTDRQNAGAAGVRGAQRAQEGLRNGGAGAPPSGDHDRPSLSQKIEAAIAGQAHPTQRSQVPFLDACDGEAIPLVAHFRPGQAKDLNRDPELEHAQAVVGHCDDKRIAVGRRGVQVWHDIAYIWRSCHPPGTSDIA